MLQQKQGQVRDMLRSALGFHPFYVIDCSFVTGR